MVVFSLIYEIIVRKIKVCEMEPLDKIEKQIYKELAYVCYVLYNHISYILFLWLIFYDIVRKTCNLVHISMTKYKMKFWCL